MFIRNLFITAALATSGGGTLASNRPPSACTEPDNLKEARALLFQAQKFAKSHNFKIGNRYLIKALNVVGYAYFDIGGGDDTAQDLYIADGLERNHKLASAYNIRESTLRTRIEAYEEKLKRACSPAQIP